MNKPNTLESVAPCSGQYSLKTDLKLNAWLAVAAPVAILGEYWWRHHSDAAVPLRVAVALSPLIPFLLYVRSGLRFIRGLDELQRQVQFEAALFATLGTLLIGTALNVLNAHGVVWPGVPHGLGYWSAFGVMFALWLVGSALANRRYK